MPKYQILAENGQIVTARIVTDDGHEEVQDSFVHEGDDKDVVLSRVAHHLNNTWEAHKLAEVAPVIQPEAEKEALLEADLK